MISAVVLSAGVSSRLGTPKQLLLYQGQPLLAHVLTSISRSLVGEVVVVLGHRAEEIRKVINNFNCKTVYNEEYVLGQSTSLKYGLSVLGNAVEAALFVLGDQPLLKPNTINYIIKNYRPGGFIVAPFYNGKRGNPVLFDKTFFPEISALSGDTGARELIKSHCSQLVRVDVDDEGVIFDVDTWDDYHQLNSIERKGRIHE